MKKANSFFLFLSACLWLTAPIAAQQQSNPLHAEVYRLENGLTIYLNEDHSLPNVFGAVAVKAGSKNDPADATGIAHYFEHILFKGTDQIGTLDYRSEKVYLDSIAVLYDALAATQNVQEKEVIQKHINNLSVKAAEFAIPNELGKILDEMGSTAVNAGTGNEEIVYFNIFPSNQIRKWLEVYSHRFINPVYRLFQSELETVYEEYNMYKDNRFATAFEAFNKAFYPSHPYGTPVIGYPEHLKNPSISKMHAFFETYYVANNMALILSGNFNAEEVKPIIEKLFGVWRSAPIPPMPKEYVVEPFKGRTVVQKRLTPIKFGILGYRLVPIVHEDRPVIDVMNKLLTNTSQTGLLDELSVDNKLLGAFAAANLQVDAGGQMIFFLPKIVGQSLKSAEQLVKQKIDDLKEGRFDDELLEGIKTQILVEHQQGFEDQYKRGYMMLMAFVKGMDWKMVVDYPNVVGRISKEEVIRAAKTYLGDDHLVFYSKTGLPGKPGPLKPAFEPIPSSNSDKRSEYASQLEDLEVDFVAPDFISFGSSSGDELDVRIMELDENVDLLYASNKINELFELKLSFGIGTYQMPILDQLAEYLMLIGTEKQTFKEFTRKMQALGGNYEISASAGDFTITCQGPDAQFEQILTLICELLYQPALDEEKVKNLYQSARASRQFEQKDPETLGYALFSFAMLGEKSPFLRRLTLKEVKNLKAAALLDNLRKVMEVELSMHYSGTVEPEVLKNILGSHVHYGPIRIESQSPVKREYISYPQPVVFFMKDNKAIQSKNYFYVPGGRADKNEQGFLNAYKEYLDGGMHSVMFQEIRELRSLAYATGAQVYMPVYEDEFTGLTAFVGTQADKTREAVEVMHGIIGNPPDKMDRMEMVKRSLIQSINSSKPTFRMVSTKVADWLSRGYQDDPRREWVMLYQRMEFGEMADSYMRQFGEKPIITTIIGNEKRMGTDWMKRFGELRTVNQKQIFN